MSASPLADFLEQLAGCGQLARVGVEVDPAAEIGEITRRVAGDGGPAVLFERVRGSSAAVVTNLLGSEARVCCALDLGSLDEIPTRIESLISRSTPQNWFERLKAGSDDSGANKFRPKGVKTGPCQQVVRLGRDVDLGALPLVGQGGTANQALVGGSLLSVARGGELRAIAPSTMVAIDPNRLAIVAIERGPFERRWAEYRQAGERMPVAVVLGGDPAATIAAQLELPGDVDFYHLVGLLRGRPVELVACRTHALAVPADAELVLEGYLDPESPTVEVGSVPARPVVHVTAITQRTHPVLPLALHTGRQGEAAALAKARERVLLPALRGIAPGVVDWHLPVFGGVERFAVVSLAKTYPHEARRAASALWGSTMLGSATMLVVVDAAVDVRNIEAVLGQVAAHFDAARDSFTYDGPARSESANGRQGLVRHVGLDATTKIAGEGSPGRSEDSAVDPAIIEQVTTRWAEYGLPTTVRASGDFPR
jgi:4-hydroxy-3-polyprenylbenzoate decarboxylase